MNDNVVEISDDLVAVLLFHFLDATMLEIKPRRYFYGVNFKAKILSITYKILALEENGRQLQQTRNREPDMDQQAGRRKCHHCEK